MTTTKRHEPESHDFREAISREVDDWIRQFIKHLELEVIDAGRSLQPNPSVSELQRVTARAILATYLDSGMEIESAMELFGQIAVERSSGDFVWSDALNERRFMLIDKEIQGALTHPERMELAGLTRMLREHVESEANLPMQGARALHRRLSQLKSSKDEPD